MKNSIFLVFLSFFVLVSTALFSQEEERLIQFSGVVVSTDSLDQVSYVNVIDKTTKTGTVSDYSGYFSFVTKPGDTILFSAFGYQSNSYIVPDTLTGQRYSIIHFMVPDTILLPEVEVYPWPSREQFSKYFVEMDPYGDDFRQFKRSLSGAQLAETSAGLRIDAGQAYNWEAQQRQTRIYTQGITPVNNLLNPISWAKFIDAWRDGQLQRE